MIFFFQFKPGFVDFVWRLYLELEQFKRKEFILLLTGRGFDKARFQVVILSGDLRVIVAGWRTGPEGGLMMFDRWLEDLPVLTSNLPVKVTDRVSSFTFNISFVFFLFTCIEILSNICLI